MFIPCHVFAINENKLTLHWWNVFLVYVFVAALGNDG